MTFSVKISSAWKLALTLGAASMIAGCSTMGEVPFKEEPELRTITTTSSELRALPRPAERVVVSVYDLPDLTGQYGETSTGGQTLSRAVTQDGVSLLIKSLQDAGERQWFTVLDRSRLDDTLKERQIVTEMRRIYRSETQISASALPPLLHASIIIEGSITGYDSYVKTGGAGAQFLGLGANSRWQQDTVTVNLRAVSTKTSEVLASITVQKSIASVEVRGSVFRYVALDRILEIEAGVTANEPKQIAVEEAVDKAVYALILEGVRNGVWTFSDAQAGKMAMMAYMEDKYDGQVPASASQSVPLETSRPASVVQTRPYTPPATPVSAPVVQPAPSTSSTQPSTPPPGLPTPPPAGSANEVLG